MADKKFEVLLTNGAKNDLEEIHYYVVTNRSVETAEKLLEDILEKIETLEKLPSRGAIPPELERLGMNDFRQLILFPYRLIYRIIGYKVYILVIADGRRDFQSLLERRLLGDI